MSVDVNMRANTWLGEDAPMSDAPDDLVEVQRRLAEIQHRKRDRIRWNMSTHTRELALVALAPPTRSKQKSAKQRRRKRSKRLL